MYWYPPSSSAFWYGGAALSNEALSDERDESRLFIYIYIDGIPVGATFN